AAQRRPDGGHRERQEDRARHEGRPDHRREQAAAGRRPAEAAVWALGTPSGETRDHLSEQSCGLLSLRVGVPASACGGFSSSVQCALFVLDVTWQSYMWKPSRTALEFERKAGAQYQR